MFLEGNSYAICGQSSQSSVFLLHAKTNRTKKNWIHERSARIEIFHLACFEKHFKASESTHNYKIQPTDRQKKFKFQEGITHSVRWTRSKKRAHKRAQGHTYTFTQMRACTNTYTHALSVVFAENLNEGLTRMSKIYGKQEGAKILRIWQDFIVLRKYVCCTGEATFIVIS